MSTLTGSPRLIDTNVLVYAYDHASAQKPRAREVLRRLWGTRSGVVSAQNLGEFWSPATHKLSQPLRPEVAARCIRRFSRMFTVLPVDAAVVQEAARGVQAYQLSYWDAQLWAVAKLHGIPTILTEDLPSRATVEGVHFINPFDVAFDPAVALG